ncbi:MAG: OB-fold nucleic acid binding domain-containing protein [Candidatus Sumerlaeales bacterium]|nr:OB-fold nucleic acid binding domain-containing protein [Candidatus Sumerlaeales bacterium]
MINITRFTVICLCILLFNLGVGAQDTTSLIKKAKDVTTQNAEKQATLVGTVENWLPSTKDAAPNSFMLCDETGKVRVCIWSDTLMKVYGVDKMKNGVKVEVTGLIKTFRGKAEVQIREGKWLKIGNAIGIPDTPKATDKPSTSTASAQLTKISTITAGLVGQDVIIEGKIGGVRAASSERAPWTINVNDGSGMALDAVFWKEEGVDLPEKKPVKDETWQICGKVNVYKGRVQLKTNYPKDWTKK